MGNSQKSHHDRSGEEAGSINTGMFLSVRNWWMESDVWTGRIVMMEHPTIPPFLWSLPSDSLSQTLQDFFEKC
jgi:hypothetical protein